MMWIVGIVSILFGAAGILGVCRSLEKRNIKENGKLIGFCLIFILVGWWLIPSATSHKTTETKPSTPSTIQETSAQTKASTTDESALNSKGIGDYDNGVILQATNALNFAKNGTTDIVSEYTGSLIDLNQFHSKYASVVQGFNNSYKMFKAERTPTGLESITSELDSELNKLQALLGKLESSDADHVSELNDQIMNVLAQADSTNKKYGDIKANVMKKSNSESSAEAMKSDSNLKDGPAKVALGGGLGDTYETIVQVFGDPTRVNQEMKDGVGMFVFEDSKILADFVQSRAYHVTYQLDKTPLSMEDAQALAKKLMPTDAKFVKQYDKDSQKFYVYQSQSLSKLFDDTWFENKDGDVQPGYLDIAYLIDGGQVRGIDSFTGDNP